MAKFYLSSTFRDLEECREEAYRTLIRMRHEVLRMEEYMADGRPPVKKCLADVSECDAYIGIFAKRYGYIPPDDNPKQKSITELEYREARRLKKETLIFILHKDAWWPGDRDPENEKERRRIKAFCDELCKSHTINFFKDSRELATWVGIVASGFPIDRIVNPLPPPLPPPPPPEPWSLRKIPESALRFLKANAKLTIGIIAALVVVLAILTFQKVFQRSDTKRPPSGPPEYPTSRKYQFLLSEKDALPETWHLLPGQWDLERGEGEDPNVAALLVKGNQMATPKDLGPRVFYNYQADFKLRFKAGDKAAWVLRAQSDGQSGYLFELRKDKGTLFIKGWILRGNKITDALPGDKILRYSTCCKLTDAIHLIADVTDNPQEGTRIKYLIKVETDFGFSTEDSYKTDDAEFIDSDSTFGWGSIGLLVTDGITQPPTTDGILKIEYVTLTPLRKNVSPNSSSNEGVSR